MSQQTVNNRVLLREVYDERSLHNLLGVAPMPAVVDPDIPKITTQGRSSTTVTSTGNGSWEQDMSVDSDKESLSHRPSSSRQDSDEVGKYNIEKRRTLHKHRASQSPQQPEVFTTDEEDSVDEEEAAYAVSIGGGWSDEPRSRMGRRRAYWLGKGIAVDSDDNSS